MNEIENFDIEDLTQDQKLTLLMATLFVMAGGESQWLDGERVRVIAEGETFGEIGTVDGGSVSQNTMSTGVVLDGREADGPAWFADYELEAV